MDLAMEDYRRALGRIAVMLVALAGLAERASARPHPLRGFVIRLLWRAETVARKLVVEALMMPVAPVPSPPRLGGDDAVDAMRLALSLRALASALDRRAVQAGSLAAGLDPDRRAIMPCMAPQAVRQGVLSISATAGFPPSTRHYAQPNADRFRSQQAAEDATPHGRWRGGVPPPAAGWTAGSSGRAGLGLDPTRLKSARR